MTTAVAALSRADRQRLLNRLAEMRELDRLIRQPGTLASPRSQDDPAAERTAP
jgi:hypothetical protein